MMAQRVVGGIGALAGAYDGFILDLWGVLHDGAVAFPGAVDTLVRLRELGKSTVLLSNSPRRAADLAGMMADLGFAADSYGAVVSSGEAVHQALLRRDDPWFAALGNRCLHLGPPRDLPIFEGLAVERVATVGQADFILNSGPGDWHETLDDYRPLLESAAAKGLPMICANPDLVVVHQGHSMICAGTLAGYYQTLGGDVRYRGKPDPAIYDICLRVLGQADRRRVLAVGDGLETDIAGAKGVGLDCLLCCGGIHAAELGISWGETPSAERLQALFEAHGGPRPTAVSPAFVW